MKRKTLITILICETALLSILVLLINRFPELFSSMLAFPFEQIALGLKALSQTGKAGNGLATALWVGISSLPLIPALRCKGNKDAVKEKIALYVLSCILLLSFYGMVNPTLFCPLIPEGENELLAVVKAVFSVSIWSIVVLYIVFRLIRLFRSGDKGHLLGYMRNLLQILCVIFLATAIISLETDLAAAIASPQKALDRVMNLLRLFAAFVPYALDIAIIFSALDLLEIVATEEQNGIVPAAEKLGKICRMALGIATALTAVLNVFQIALMRWLSNVTAAVSIPITSIVFTCIVLLFSRLLAENKQLRDDNSLFI